MEDKKCSQTNSSEKTKSILFAKGVGIFRSVNLFFGVRIVDADALDRIPSHAQIAYCGKIKDNELLFRTVDGRFYFSLLDGWGSEGGTLYGLSDGFCFDFKHPTNKETILFECEAQLGTYHSWAGAMAYHERKRILKTIASVMKKEVTV